MTSMPRIFTLAGVVVTLSHLLTPALADQLLNQLTKFPRNKAGTVSANGSFKARVHPKHYALVWKYSKPTEGRFVFARIDEKFRPKTNTSYFKYGFNYTIICADGTLKKETQRVDKSGNAFVPVRDTPEKSKNDYFTAVGEKKGVVYDNINKLYDSLKQTPDPNTSEKLIALLIWHIEGIVMKKMSRKALGNQFAENGFGVIGQIPELYPATFQCPATQNKAKVDVYGNMNPKANTTLDVPNQRMSFQKLARGVGSKLHRLARKFGGRDDGYSALQDVMEDSGSETSVGFPNKGGRVPTTDELS